MAEPFDLLAAPSDHRAGVQLDRDFLFGKRDRQFRVFEKTSVALGVGKNRRIAAGGDRFQRLDDIASVVVGQKLDEYEPRSVHRAAGAAADRFGDPLMIEDFRPETERQVGVFFLHFGGQRAKNLFRPGGFEFAERIIVRGEADGPRPRRVRRSDQRARFLNGPRSVVHAVKYMAMQIAKTVHISPPFRLTNPV